VPDRKALGRFLEKNPLNAEFLRNFSLERGIPRTAERIPPHRDPSAGDIGAVPLPLRHHDTARSMCEQAHLIHRPMGCSRPRLTSNELRRHRQLQTFLVGIADGHAGEAGMS
jgi:hypothetical protein